MAPDRTDDEPAEPEEYDPEAEFRDPDSDSLTIPRVDTEDAGSGLTSELREELESDDTDEFEASAGMEDVSSDLLKTFWAVVLVVNAGVLAIALGLLLVFFDGTVSRGGALVVGGIVLLGFALRRYRRYQDSSDDASSEEPTADEKSAIDPSSEELTGDEPGVDPSSEEPETDATENDS